MVICLEQGADLHMGQLMPLSLTVSWFSKIQIGFTFLVLAHPGSPGQRAVKCVCKCVCVYCAHYKFYLYVFLYVHAACRLWPVNNFWTWSFTEDILWQSTLCITGNCKRTALYWPRGEGFISLIYSCMVSNLEKLLNYCYHYCLLKVGIDFALVSLSSLMPPPIAEWLASWTQAQKGLGSYRSCDTVG